MQTLISLRRAFVMSEIKKQNRKEQRTHTVRIKIIAPMVCFFLDVFCCCSCCANVSLIRPSMRNRSLNAHYDLFIVNKKTTSYMPIIKWSELALPFETLFFLPSIPCRFNKPIVFVWFCFNMELIMRSHTSLRAQKLQCKRRHTKKLY